ncbi:hypothetical protein IKF92_01675 [Candidatus Saccharibacteria bacterium]|nr:hypothetical protein [Candidatus Saccharibacteria bacterium]
MRRPERFNLTKEQNKNSENLPENLEEKGWDSVATQADKKDFSSESMKGSQNESENLLHEHQQEVMDSLQKRAKELAKKANAVETPGQRFQHAEEKKEAIRKESEKFANNISNLLLMDVTIHEESEIKRLQKETKQYDDSFGRHSFFEKRQRAKDEIDLERYGYNPDGDDDSTYRKIIQISKIGQPRDRIEFAKQRAENWFKLNLKLNSKNAREIKKSLKKAGLNKIPDSWNDKEVTSSEISRMLQIAESFDE